MVTSILSVSDTSEQEEKRVCQRIELNRQVQIKISDGQILNGLTEDISLSGLRVAIEGTFSRVDLNVIEPFALLQVQFADGELSTEFPCTIVRCGSDSVCLKLDKKKAASFGMMLTRGTFKKKKSRHN